MLTLGISIGLRAGGYSIYFRHAMASVCQDCFALGTAATTKFPDWWKSCDSECVPHETCTAAERSTPRQLSAEGRTQAQTIGAAFHARDFPVGRVVSSEYCRCVQTAELMNFGPPIQTDQGITSLVYDEAKRCTHALDLIAERPKSNTNTVIIAHAMFTTCPTVEITFLQMGDGAIYKPGGAGGAVYIATVTAAEWATLP
jgi:phosphohistidine phosphatase SixA